MKLVLGSASPSRKRILKQMGFEFGVLPADIDEKAIRDPDPKKLVLKLARAKAEAIIPKLNEPVILITADSVVYFEGRIIEKAGSKAETRKILKSYQGKPIEHITGLVVTNTGTKESAEGADVAKLRFKPLDDKFIDTIAESGRVCDKAGAFAIEFLEFEPYIVEIVGERESVMGFPKMLFQKLFKSVK